MRTRLTVAYKYKLLIYSKILIFALLYSLGFIVMNIIIIYNNINYYIYGFMYNYFFNIALEQFLFIIMAILFYPIKNSIVHHYYHIDHIDFNSIYFISEITKNKEKSMKISKLSQKILREEYLQSEYPLILVEPFTKTNKIFNKRFLIHIGVTINN